MRKFNLPKIDVRTPTMETVSSTEFVQGVVPQKRVHFQSRSEIVQVRQDISSYQRDYYEHKGIQVTEEMRRKSLAEQNKPTSTVSKFVTSLHSAFAEHIPFTLSPDVIMTIVSQEIAQFVKNNSENQEIAKLFTKTPGEKQNINVEVDDFVYGSEHNDWMRGIEGFRVQLIEKVPSGVMEHMTPRMSVATPETNLVHLVSFMDAASKYYSYSMSTCCGVPAFNIEGTADDWDGIIRSAGKLTELLPGMALYFQNLVPILREIRNTAAGNKVDNDFWASIYKVDNGSGGPYNNGWFNNFYAHHYGMDYRTRQFVANFKNEQGSYDYTLMDGNGYKISEYNNQGYFPGKRGGGRYGGPKLNNFPSNLSNVPFTWKYLGSEIPMAFVGGVTGVEMVDGFLTPRLGISVVELNSTKKGAE
jgi:hypothetical protein